MEIITDEILQEIEAQEKSSWNPIRARGVLERVLAVQFRAIADGLLAYLILQNSDEVSELILSWHYIALTGSTNISSPNYNDSKFKKFCEEFVDNISTRRVKIISPSELARIQIRIFGGEVYLWNDVQINKQLVLLGSEHRLFFAGAHDVTYQHIQELLEVKSDQFIDCRFIFGTIGSISTLALVRVLDFNQELAVSPFTNLPYLGTNNIGCAFYDIQGSQIIIRRMVMNLSSDTNILSSTLSHEMGHIPQIQRQNFIQNGYWLDDIKHDICRFVQSPKTLFEVRKEFDGTSSTLGSLQRSVLTLNLMHISKENSKYDLNKIIEKLIIEMQENKTILVVGDNLYSPVFENCTFENLL